MGGFYKTHTAYRLLVCRGAICMSCPKRKLNCDSAGTSTLRALNTCAPAPAAPPATAPIAAPLPPPAKAPITAPANAPPPTYLPVRLLAPMPSFAVVLLVLVVFDATEYLCPLTLIERSSRATVLLPWL